MPWGQAEESPNLATKIPEEPTVEWNRCKRRHSHNRAKPQNGVQGALNAQSCGRGRCVLCNYFS